jgi:retron-type reverse transcriptase
MVVGPIFENGFLDMIHGFRTGRGGTEALREVSEYIGQGYTHVVDDGIKGYFDNFAHDELMVKFRGRHGVGIIRTS